MRRPAELDDWDRPMSGAKYVRILSDWQKENGLTSPMGASKRIPSPYSGPPVVPRPTPTPWLGIFAVAVIGACSLATFGVGALTILDWLKGAF